MMPMLASAGSTNVLWPPLDELIIGAVCFLIVFGALAKFALPKIKQVLEEREEAIAGGLRDAEDARAAAEQLRQSYRAELDRARQEAAEIRTAAEAERSTIVADAHRDAVIAGREAAAVAHAEIEAERTRAATELRHDLGRLATDLAERILGEALANEARASAVVDRFIDELETAAAEVRSS